MLKNIKIKKLLFIITLVFLFNFLSQSRLIVSAKTSNVDPEISKEDPNISNVDSAISVGSKEKVFLPNPLNKGESPGSTTPSTLFSNIIKLLLGAVGTLSLAVFIYGGGVWLTSRGNQEQVKKGKDAFVYALIGLAVVFGSYAILNLIITALTG
ncbi:MAG: pilin [bacterium]